MNAKSSRRFRKALSAIAILTLATLTGGMSYEAIGRVSNARRFPVRGQMVDIGDYRLNINCTGVGTPTVILDSGLGEPSLSWIGVSSRVSSASPGSALTIGRAMDTVILVRTRAPAFELPESYMPYCRNRRRQGRMCW